jgi:hypothetical protein
MRKTGVLALFAAIVAVLVAAGSASAGGGHGKVLYEYWGQVEATGSASVTITVQNGNHAALRSLIGQSQMQTFATDAKTVFLEWSQGKPTVVGIGDLAQHDYVRINVRADRGASLDTVKATPAKLVGDHGPTVNRPKLPLYLFRGTLVSGGGGKVTIDVRGGNRHGLRLLIGQSAQQTFSYDDGTVFLHWEHRIPTVVDPSALKPGDRIVIRVRAAKGSSLAQVESTPARRVADREPKNQEANQNAQS